MATLVGTYSNAPLGVRLISMLNKVKPRSSWQLALGPTTMLPSDVRLISMLNNENEPLHADSLHVKIYAQIIYDNPALDEQFIFWYYLALSWFRKRRPRRLFGPGYSSDDAGDGPSVDSDEEDDDTLVTGSGDCSDGSEWQPEYSDRTASFFLS